MFKICIFFVGAALLLPSSFSAPNNKAGSPASDIIQKENRDGILYYRCVQNGTIALTFDDGPASGPTEELLIVLSVKNVSATFFVVGINTGSESSEETLRRTVAQGHRIGHHSWSHTWPGLIDLEESALLAEMNLLTEALDRIIGQRPNIHRPPFGAFDDPMLSIVNGRLGFKLILWSIDTNDWQHPGDTAAGLEEYAKILEGTDPQMTPGYIALHHDPLEGSSELASTSIDYARSKGYRFVTLAECMGLDDKVHP